METRLLGRTRCVTEVAGKTSDVTGILTTTQVAPEGGLVMAPLEAVVVILRERGLAPVRHRRRRPRVVAEPPHRVLVPLQTSCS